MVSVVILKAGKTSIFWNKYKDKSKVLLQCTIKEND